MRELNIIETEEVTGGEGECKYAGAEYSNGTEMEQAGVSMVCTNGQWVEKS